MNSIRLVVYGVPAAKGSTRAFLPKGWTRPIVTTTSRSSKSWEGLIAEAASRALNGRGQLLLGAVRVDVEFYLPRPKSLPKTREVAMTKKPDADKLLRCVLDALAGVLFRDDSQVTRITTGKQYANLGDSPRAEISIEPLEAAEQLFFEANTHEQHSQAEETTVRAD